MELPSRRLNGRGDPLLRNNTLPRYDLCYIQFPCGVRNGKMIMVTSVR
jgi:hypothetical protein